jgi:hypothetical protein
MVHNDDGVAGLLGQYRTPKHPISRGARLYAQWQANIRGGEHNPPFHELLPLVLAHVPPEDVKVMSLIDSLQIVARTRSSALYDALARELQQSGIVSKSNRRSQVFIRCTR